MKLTTTLKSLHKSFISAAATLALVTSVHAADCTYELFSISGKRGMSINDYVDQLSNECDLSIIISDPEAEKMMAKKLQRTNFKNLTLNEVFDLLLIENNLNYTLEENILKITFVQTHTYSIDYIISARKSISATDVILSNTGTTTSTGGGSEEGGSSEEGLGNSTNATSGIQIQSLDEVVFWEELDLELQRILNRPSDFYQAEAPIVNRNAGLVTVTATVSQQKRLEDYLVKLQKKIQNQVLIDVRLLTVTFDDKSSTGVDWSQIYALQNFTFGAVAQDMKNVAGYDYSTYSITDAAAPGVGSTSISVPEQGYSGPTSLMTMIGGGSVDEVVKFLKTQGDVDAISNPKIMTLNNQPALITVGTEYFYKIQTSSVLAGTSAGTSTTTQNDTVNSIFAGVLLDITPEIADDDTITLKISPSISQTRITLSSDPTSQQSRTMPPDLDRRQLASVVTVKDGMPVIIGGLIDERMENQTNKVPLLGDIPLLGNAFKYEEKKKTLTELVMIIQPHIIRKNSKSLSLAKLGYKHFTDDEYKMGAEEPNEPNAAK